MIKILIQEVMAAILSHNPEETLATLQRNKSLFLDPLFGVNFHAEALYLAIKVADQAVVEYLCRLNIHSSISFFKLCGHSPLSLALELGRSELIPILLENTDKNFALHMAVNLKQEGVKALLLTKKSPSSKLMHFLGL